MIPNYCRTCGHVFEEGELPFTDVSTLELAHGFGVYCKKCYLEQGHWECPCGGAYPFNEWNFCPQCGFKKEDL